MMITSNSSSLYIHIPYCKKLCFYCDFCKKNYNFFECKEYINDLVKDLKSTNKKYKTIYVGGGTPSCIDQEFLNILLTELKNHLQNNYEFTVESNVEDLNEDFLSLLIYKGVNRLSIGVQTFNNDILKKINRTYDIDIINKINLAKKYFNNINLDIIYGIPFSNFSILKDDLKIAVSLNPQHLSFYSLIVNPNTMFFNMKIEESNDDFLRQEYDYIVDFLNNNGFEHYEVSNFAKKGYESRHNLVYWRNETYDALGVSASGFDGNYRYKYTNSVKNYLKDHKLIENIKISKKEDFEYQILLGLRISEGISLDKIKEKFNIDLLKDKKEIINKLIETDFINIENNHLKCTKKGSFVQEEIYRQLIE